MHRFSLLIAVLISFASLPGYALDVSKLNVTPVGKNGNKGSNIRAVFTSPGLTITDAGDVSVQFAGFTFTAPVSDFKSKKKNSLLIYKGQKGRSGLSKMIINLKKNRIVLIAKHIPVPNLLSPLQLRFDAGSFSDCAVIGVKKAKSKLSANAKGKKKKNKNKKGLRGLKLDKRIRKGMRCLVDKPSLFPEAIVLDAPQSALSGTHATAKATVTQVRVEATLLETPDPGSVQLFRANKSGKPVGSPLCTMSDDGGAASGDTTAGDNVFTCIVAFSESKPKTIHLVVVAVVDGKTVYATGTSIRIVKLATTIQLNQVEDVLDEAFQIWTKAYRKKGNTFNAKTYTVLKINELKGVIEAVLVTGQESIQIKMQSGINAILPLFDPTCTPGDSECAVKGLRCSSHTENSAASLFKKSAATAQNNRTIIQNKKVLIWDPGFFDNKSFPLTISGVTSNGNVERIVLPDVINNAVCPPGGDFSVDIVQGASANLASVKNFGNGYGAVLLTTHGSRGGFVTGEVFDPDTPPSIGSIEEVTRQLQSHELKIVREWLPGANGQSNFYSVTDSYLKMLGGINLDNAIVFNNSCSSTAAPSLQNTFFNLGAGYYIGYSRPVSDNFARFTAEEYFTNLVQKLDTADKAYENASTTVDPDTLESPPQFQTRYEGFLSPDISELGFLGEPEINPENPQLQVEDTVLLTASVEGADDCALRFDWTTTRQVGDFTDLPDSNGVVSKTDPTITYKADDVKSGADTVTVEVFATGGDQPISLGKKSIQVTVNNICTACAAPLTGGATGGDHETQAAVSCSDPIESCCSDGKDNDGDTDVDCDDSDCASDPNCQIICPSLNDGPYASGCGTVSAPAIGMPGNSFAVSYNSGCGAAKLSVSHALTSVLIDGTPVTGSVGTAPVYPGYSPPKPLPDVSVVVDVPAGGHTVTFTIDPTAAPECITIGSTFAQGPWVVLGGFSPNIWSTPVHFEIH